LSEVWSTTVLQNKLPYKQSDPGSFTIPCNIGSMSFSNVLADLGSSINLMPYSLFSKLNVGEPRPTPMTIQLADRSIKYPRGIVENILVKIDKFIFPVDFVILDMDEDERLPLILGRPFLATSRALIDVLDGKLTLRVADEHVTFDAGGTIRDSSTQCDTHFETDTITTSVSQSVLGCLRESVGMHVVNHGLGMRVRSHEVTTSKNVQKIGDEFQYMDPP